MVICSEQGADWLMAQLIPLPLTISCFSKIQIGLPFWYRLTWVVPEKGPLNGCVCAEFVGQTSLPYKRIGKYFDLIDSNNTSSDELRPVFPNISLKISRFA